MSQPTCILCAYYHPKAEPHAPEPGWQTCLSGRDRLEHELFSLRSAFLRLDEEVAVETGAKDAISQLLPGAPTPSPSNQPSVSGSRERRLPIDAARIDLLLPVVPGYVRDPHRDQVGHLSVATVLNEWVAAWHDRWYPHERYPRTDAVSLIDWIRQTRLQTIAHHEEALADFADEIRELRGRLRSVFGETKTKPVAMWGVPCPHCKLISQLMLDPDDPDHYRECANCGAMLSRSEYLQHLRDIIDEHRGRRDEFRSRRGVADG
jgi:hypothetical protein